MTAWGDIVLVERALMRRVTVEGQWRYRNNLRRRKDRLYVGFETNSDAIPMGAELAPESKALSASSRWGHPPYVAWWTVPIEPVIGFVTGFSVVLEGFTTYEYDEMSGNFQQTARIPLVEVSIEPKGGKTALVRVHPDHLSAATLGDMVARDMIEGVEMVEADDEEGPA